MKASDELCGNIYEAYDVGRFRREMRADICTGFEGTKQTLSLQGHERVRVERKRNRERVYVTWRNHREKVRAA